MKGIQTRLDQILGAQGSKGKDVYDSKTSLASKIVNIERQVDSIDEKLQSFIEMYQRDRDKLDRELLCKSESVKVDLNAEAMSSKPYHATMLNCSQETVIENLIDGEAESSPDSELSTATSVIHESEVKNSNKISIFKRENAFKV